MEKIQKITLIKGHESAIVTKYPFWMKWLVKYVELYIIPDINDRKQIYNSTFPCDLTKKEIKNIISMHSCGIGSIT